MLYEVITDIEFVVSFGWFLRALHRVAAHLMVATVFLHMVRVFLTGAYKNGEAVGANRPLNWIVGLLLLGLTLLLSFTGYLLPWDHVITSYSIHYTKLYDGMKRTAVNL